MVWISVGNRDSNALAELQDLRIAMGPPASGSREVALQLLEQARLDMRDTTLSELNGEEAVGAMRQNRIDTLAREDLHPAMRRLATAVAMNVYEAGGLFHRAGDSPSLRRIVFATVPQSRNTPSTACRCWSGCCRCGGRSFFSEFC